MGQSSNTSFHAGLASDSEVELIIGGLNCRSCFPKSVPPIIFKRYARLLNVVDLKLFNAELLKASFQKY